MKYHSRTLDFYLIKSFIPIFFVALLFFVLILEMVDVFANIVQYIQNEAETKQILYSMFLYIPKCASWAFPIAILFAVSYTLGTMYANNELIVVLGSGVSLRTFTLPFILFSLFLSVSFFFFDNYVVIPTLVKKEKVVNKMKNVGEDPGASNIILLGNGQQYLWNVKYFDYKTSAMTSVTIIERDPNGMLVSRLDAQSAVWENDKWVFKDVRRFFWKDGNMTDLTYGTWQNDVYNELPESFNRKEENIDVMKLADAKQYIKYLKRSKLPYSSQLAEYLQRFAYALTPLIVTLLSAAIVGRYRKNVLLMSLLQSLIAATIYYVAQMVFMLLAKNETISPFLGAFAPLFIFSALVLVIFAKRKA